MNSQKGYLHLSLADLKITEPFKGCAKASELTYAGQYEQAKEALGEMWQGVGERPAVGEYAPEVMAELLLQCGTLSGFLGDAQARDVHCWLTH